MKPDDVKLDGAPPQKKKMKNNLTAVLQLFSKSFCYIFLGISVTPPGLKSRKKVVERKQSIHSMGRKWIIDQNNIIRNQQTVLLIGI